MVVVLAAAIPSIGLFLAGTSCQSIKGRKGDASIGANVQMLELREAIQAKVKDADRSKELLEMVSQTERQLGLVNQSYLETGRKFGKLAADHSKDANDLIGFLNQWEAEVGQKRQAIFNQLLAMKTRATAEEWPAISSAFLNSALDQSDRARSVRGAGDS